jgi:transcription elongation GreA/GreB family factor
VLSERGDDRLNGILLLSSPLAKALTDAAEGDEITINVAGRERPLLLVSLEKELRQAA